MRTLPTNIIIRQTHRLFLVTNRMPNLLGNALPQLIFVMLNTANQWGYCITRALRDCNECNPYDDHNPYYHVFDVPKIAAAKWCILFFFALIIKIQIIR